MRASLSHGLDLCEQCDRKSKKSSGPCKSENTCKRLKNVWGKEFCEAQMSKKVEAPHKVRRTEPEAGPNCECQSGGGGHFETEHWETGCSCLRGDPC